jgi:S-adenosylmethionine:tRNA ribosyltransferase-isomerase
LRPSDFHFDLPPDRIAQTPAVPRDHARLMVLEREGGRIHHARFDTIGAWLRSGDLLVVNDTRVIPARVYGRKDTGGWIEALLVEELAGGAWRALVRGRGRLEEGRAVHFDGAHARLRQRLGGGEWVLAFDPPDVRSLLERCGRMPLPPYIARPREGDSLAEQDHEWYQTVFARHPGAIAAPTAGLHFTPELLARLRTDGVEAVAVTLHVGPGTFRPVKVEDLAHHRMDAEAYDVSGAVAVRLTAARAEGRRVIAVGTTATRTLETVWEDGRYRAGSGRTGLFIHPPYPFRAIDALLTNFHLPEGTPIMLAAAFAGRERLLEAYRAAVAEGYRFFSYGDAMLIV